MSAHDDLAGCANCGGVAATTRRGSTYDPSVPDRVRALALDIAHRLRPVCAHMPHEELSALSMRMALVELKYFESTAPTSLRKRPATG